MENSFIYSGASMLGTFCPGDRLIIMPTAAHEIHTGDIIVFEAHNGKKGPSKLVVHRVWAKITEGFVTKGDNNFHKDIIRVSPRQIKGRVAYRIRNGQKHRVHNGRQGFIRARMLDLWNHTKKSGRKLLKIPYRWLKGTHIIARLWRPQIKRIIIRSSQEKIIKYVHKKRVVGYFWPDKQKHLIKKPYDLIIKPPDSSH